MKSLEVNPCDDIRLIGLLILALDANNVMIQTDDYKRPERKPRSVDHRGRRTH